MQQSRSWGFLAVRSLPDESRDLKQLIDVWFVERLAPVAGSIDPNLCSESTYNV